eukprot:4098457-Prymnesium_polylepis.1
MLTVECMIAGLRTGQVRHPSQPDAPPHAPPRLQPGRLLGRTQLSRAAAGTRPSAVRPVRSLSVGRAARRRRRA